MNDASPSPSPPAAPPPPPPGAGFWADFDKALSPPRPPPLAEPKAAAEPPRRRKVGPGQRLGPWELLGTLGRGGMGEVFVAFYGPGHRRFALKILDGDARDDPEARKRFEYEFWSLDRLHRELHHESIVAPFCAGEDDGLLWYAMELLKGESLDHVANREILAPLRVCRIGVQIADACAGMHGIGLIHRDLKPGNIFLLEGEGDRVKLLDTGIAKLLPEFFADAEMRPRVEERVQTLAGVPIGTAGFMAPEVILGAKAAAPAQDIFGLAATLFRLAVGRHAYQSVLCPGPDDEPRWSDALGHPLPMSLELVLRKALMVDPACRQPTMSELRDQLALVLEELEAEAQEDTEETSRSGEPAREDPPPTVIESAAMSGSEHPPADLAAATEVSPDAGDRRESDADGREAIAIESAARPSAADDLPAPLDPAPAADRGPRAPPPGDDDRRGDPKVTDEPAGPPPTGGPRAFLAVALVCAAVGLAVGHVATEVDTGIAPWARGVVAAVKHLPPPPLDGDAADDEGPRPTITAATESAPQAENPAADDAEPIPDAIEVVAAIPPRPRPRPLAAAAFLKLAETERPALGRCERWIPKGAPVDAVVRVSADGSVSSVRLDPDVSSLALACASEVFEGLRFPPADVASTHTWSMVRPQGREE